MQDVEVDLFKEWTNDRIVIRTGSATYAHNPEPGHNWTWHAFKGFERLSQRATGQDKIRSFASVGTGLGLDAIGACLFFQDIRTVYLTDVHKASVDSAVDNVRRNVRDGVEVVGLVGDVCYPMRDVSPSLDLIYANLPTIPQVKAPLLDPGTFFIPRDEDRWAEDTAAYMLSLQFRLLRSARGVLAPGGAVILMIGDRYPPGTLDRLARAASYEFEPVWTAIKPQTEALATITGFAGFEDGIEFDFFDYDSALQALDGSAELPPADAKETLRAWRMTANQALTALRAGRRVGHIVHVVRAIPA